MTAENEAHERAASGLEKAWEGQPVHKIESERLKLIKIHESLITAGLHRGRINLATGLNEPYLIADLPAYDEMQRLPVLQSDNVKSWNNDVDQVTHE